jgi:hypothetical protein
MTELVLRQAYYRGRILDVEGLQGHRGALGEVKVATGVLNGCPSFRYVPRLFTRRPPPILVTRLSP